MSQNATPDIINGLIDQSIVSLKAQIASLLFIEDITTTSTTTTTTTAAATTTTIPTTTTTIVPTTTTTTTSKPTTTSTTTTTTTNSSVLIPGGISSNALTYNNISNQVITGLSFDGGSKNVNLLTLNNCVNVKVTLCRFANTTGFAIKMVNCTNCIIDHNFFTFVATGVFAQTCISTKITYNQGLNRYLPTWNNYYSHWVQLNTCSGGGQQVNNNIFEDIDNVAVNPHDSISIYESNGLSTDPIQVNNNWLRGGQLSKWPGANDGACGIVLGDVNGSYQVASGNILVNPGAGGVANIGNGLGIKIDHNKIFSKQTPVTGQGLGIINSNLTDVEYNNVNWTNSQGLNAINSSPYSQYYIDKTPKPTNWSTNTFSDKTITANILPTTIITYK